MESSSGSSALQALTIARLCSTVGAAARSAKSSLFELRPQLFLTGSKALPDSGGSRPGNSAARASILPLALNELRPLIASSAAFN